MSVRKRSLEELEKHYNLTLAQNQSDWTLGNTIQSQTCHLKDHSSLFTTLNKCLNLVTNKYDDFSTHAGVFITNLTGVFVEFLVKYHGC
ncbi:unnamed protein product [Trichobilharzia szidati]|nr:unnamed protein product [Trichobilharzia szidati]